VKVRAELMEEAVLPSSMRSNIRQEGCEEIGPDLSPVADEGEGRRDPSLPSRERSEGVASKESRIEESRNMTVRCFNILNL
jgi:hypothetical protein